MVPAESLGFFLTQRSFFVGPLPIPGELGFDCFEAWIFAFFFCLPKLDAQYKVSIIATRKKCYGSQSAAGPKSVLLVCGTVYMHWSP